MHNYRLGTKCVHGHSIIEPNKATKVNISLANCYSKTQVEYARFGTYNSDRLEAQLGNLYGKDIGSAVFESGQQAWNSLVEYFITYNDNVEIIIDYDGYSEVLQALEFYKKIVKVTYINIDKDAEIINAIKDNNNTILFMFDSPTNPEFVLHDVGHIIGTVKSNNPNAYIIFDNTMATVMFQNPFNYDVDFVSESLTKYMAGHGDAIGGALYSKHKEVLHKIKVRAAIKGSFLDPVSCFLIQRGIATFALRMERITKNAKYVYELLSKYTDKIRYVGYGGVIIFTFGNTTLNIYFLNFLNLFTKTTSFGHDDSIAGQTWRPIKWNENDTHTSIRLSIGIENINDIVYDIKQAYIRVKKKMTEGNVNVINGEE